MRQFCLLCQPKVRFIAKQNSLMKIGNNDNLVLGPFDESTPCLMIVLMNCQTKLRINHLTAVKSVAILESDDDTCAGTLSSNYHTTPMGKGLNYRRPLTMVQNYVVSHQKALVDSASVVSVLKLVSVVPYVEPVDVSNVVSVVPYVEPVDVSKVVSVVDPSVVPADVLSEDPDDVIDDPLVLREVPDVVPDDPLVVLCEVSEVVTDDPLVVLCEVSEVVTDEPVVEDAPGVTSE
ncbi:alpha-2 adrenergic receptor [Trichonephila clavipes]|nr:alpha-2 adrenergic receptor [Trichonephila clavipes]